MKSDRAETYGHRYLAAAEIGSAAAKMMAMINTVHTLERVMASKVGKEALQRELDAGADVQAGLTAARIEMCSGDPNAIVVPVQNNLMDLTAGQRTMVQGLAADGFS